MRDEGNLIPVESDVNQFLAKEQFMLDTAIADVFREFKIGSLLNACNIRKRNGHPVNKIVFDLVNIPFLLMSSIFLFVRSQYETAASDKNRFYRLLENANYNWRLFISTLSFFINQKIKVKNVKEIFFVIDDTITQVSGKLVEAASYVYDHSSGKSVLGFQKLVLGIFNGSHFVPISQKITSGKHKPEARSKAKKYKKIPKSERIFPQSQGAMERADLYKTKLKGAISLLKAAKRKGFKATTVLFDSWYCFNSFIKELVEEVHLQVICQLKNLPRPNKYHYKGKAYSLNELFSYYARNKLRMIKKYQFQQSVLVVGIPKSNIRLKIVFVQNQGSDKWHAFAATDTSLSAQAILEYYSQRWSIEVFFKNCKQYLNYGKEQMSNLDSIIACDAMVFMRYLILTYLASKDKATFYDKFNTLRDAYTTNTFGMRLLQYFMNKFRFIVNEIYILLKEGYQESALKLLESVVIYLDNQRQLEIDLK
jgi:hypothetical protein